MPRFTAKPIIVEACQFHGIISDLPVEFARYLTQGYAGEIAYLPSTVLGYDDGNEETAAKYALADIVHAGDWLVRRGEKLMRMSQAEFNDAFEEADDPASPGDTQARWLARYNGYPQGGGPTVLHWLGYAFHVGQLVGVNNPEHAKLIGGNGCFSVIPNNEVLNDADGGSIGGEGAEEVGDRPDFEQPGDSGAIEFRRPRGRPPGSGRSRSAE